MGIYRCNKLKINLLEFVAQGYIYLTIMAKMYVYNKNWLVMHNKQVFACHLQTAE